MKKLLATILALVMALGLCSVSWATAPAAYVAEIVGGNQYATLAPDASVENRGIDEWLDENGVAKLGNDITISTSAMSTYGNLASVPLWTKIPPPELPRLAATTPPWIFTFPLLT